MRYSTALAVSAALFHRPSSSAVAFPHDSPPTDTFNSFWDDAVRNIDGSGSPFTISPGPSHLRFLTLLHAVRQAESLQPTQDTSERVPVYLLPSGAFQWTYEDVVKNEYAASNESAGDLALSDRADRNDSLNLVLAIGARIPVLGAAETVARHALEVSRALGESPGPLMDCYGVFDLNQAELVLRASSLYGYPQELTAQQVRRWMDSIPIEALSNPELDPRSESYVEGALKSVAEAIRTFDTGKSPAGDDEPAPQSESPNGGVVKRWDPAADAESYGPSGDIGSYMARAMLKNPQVRPDYIDEVFESLASRLPSGIPGFNYDTAFAKIAKALHQMALVAVQDDTIIPPEYVAAMDEIVSVSSHIFTPMALARSYYITLLPQIREKLRKHDSRTVDPRKEMYKSVIRQSEEVAYLADMIYTMTTNVLRGVKGMNFRLIRDRAYKLVDAPVPDEPVGHGSTAETIFEVIDKLYDPARTLATSQNKWVESQVIERDFINNRLQQGLTHGILTDELPNLPKADKKTIGKLQSPLTNRDGRRVLREELQKLQQSSSFSNSGNVFRRLRTKIREILKKLKAKMAAVGASKKPAPNQPLTTAALPTSAPQPSVQPKPSNPFQPDSSRWKRPQPKKPFENTMDELGEEEEEEEEADEPIDPGHVIKEQKPRIRPIFKPKPDLRVPIHEPELEKIEEDPNEPDEPVEDGQLLGINKGELPPRPPRPPRPHHSSHFGFFDLLSWLFKPHLPKLPHLNLLNLIPRLPRLPEIPDLISTVSHLPVLTQFSSIPEYLAKAPEVWALIDELIPTLAEVPELASIAPELLAIAPPPIPFPLLFPMIGDDDDDDDDDKDDENDKHGQDHPNEDRYGQDNSHKEDHKEGNKVLSAPVVVPVPIMSPGTTKTETFIRTEGTTQTNTFTRIVTILPSTGHVQTPGAQMATPSTFRTLTRPVKSTYGYPGQTGGVKPTAMQGTVTHSTPYAYMGPEHTASNETPEYLPLTTPNMPLTTPNTYKGSEFTRTSKALEYLPLTTPYPSLMSNPYYRSPSWNQTYSLRSKMTASVHTTGMASASTAAKDPFYGAGTTITASPTAAEGTSPPGYGMGLTRTITLTDLVTTKIPYPTAAESSPATPSSNFTEHSGSIGWTRPAHERLHGGPLSDMNEGLPAAARRPPLGSLAGAAHWPSNATQPQSPNSEGDGHSNATLARRDWHDPTALVHKDPLTGQMTIEVLPHLKCYHVGRSFKRKQMVPLIDQFCLNHDKAFLSAGEDIKEVGKVRHDGILYDRLIMRVKKLDWSESRIIDAASCRRNLRKIMDGCDTRSEEYKYGGKATFYAGPYAGEEWQLDPEMEH